MGDAQGRISRGEGQTPGLLAAARVSPWEQRLTFQGQMEHILTAAHGCLSGDQVFVRTMGALTVEPPPHLMPGMSELT